MQSDKPHTWQAVNYQHLIAALNQLQLDFFSDALSENEKSLLITDADDLNGKQITRLHLERLCRIFNLSAFERCLLLLCVGFELLPDFPQHCAKKLGEKNAMDYPNLSMALRLFSAHDAAACNPQSPFFYWQLITAEKSAPFFTQPLRINETILPYLLGYPAKDKQLVSLLTPLFVEDQPAIRHCYAQQIQQLTQLWQSASSAMLIPCLSGDDMASQRQIVVQSCADLQFPLYWIDAHAVPEDHNLWQNRLQLLIRETWLHFNRVYLIESDNVPVEKQRAMVQLLQALPANCVLIGRMPLPGISYLLTTITTPALTPLQQQQLWRQLLNESSSINPETLAQITAQFDLCASQIAQITTAMNATIANEQTAVTDDTLWKHCRRHLRRNVAGLVNVIEPHAHWQDLILPAAQIALLKTLAMQIKQRNTVYQHWGFAEKNRRGLGICALFTGPSGTGKTLAAEVIAQELQLDIYHVDLGVIVSKYIGETEKNLKQIFDHAEASGAILLFDEADALFSKRTEVKDSHDHYANLQVNYLLQRIESYRGLSILTTNLRHALDEAFLRRIRFIVNFTFPDQQQRREIWQNAFPPQTPTQDLDYHKLARLNLAGGHIRNIALGAAFFAADQQQPVMMQHVLQAAQGEYMKLERVLTEAEVKDWV